MKILFWALGLVIALSLSACSSNNEDASNTTLQPKESEQSEQFEQPGAGRDLIKFPENYDEGVLYTTVNRGNMRGEIYTSREVIEAVQDGQPIPSGTVITYKIFRDEELSRYFVMEKRDGWGAQYPPDMRNGEWEYQVFAADGAVAYEEDIGRCFTCHANQERDDYMNRLDVMKSYELDGTASTESSTNSLLGEDWEVIAINLDDSQDINMNDKLSFHEGESSLLDKENGDQEKEKMIQEVLLTFSLYQENNFLIEEDLSS